ncbi:uncharacterized protein ACLA_023690 [Aspergillus clavatus NRRL 1]|uniref:Uncharacterized protein n=1 Tax=Aspergillus clavatus (strain ATCC 1007 / CBS 513.65 / DSM 816 / NCTC 3887 / NRRL 1 / QM 1276 / 107) TaxID=344612 RepID=A1CPT4_ASPCL|nr:uncharacterized protein ACLA_023690 [Aspergillus clavatus NRRL 1]EAW07655.1 hypothetical protein ACLA_023690 [Aspergillus clavatus NRRL 1]
MSDSYNQYPPYNAAGPNGGAAFYGTPDSPHTQAQQAYGSYHSQHGLSQEPRQYQNQPPQPQKHFLSPSDALRYEYGPGNGQVGSNYEGSGRPGSNAEYYTQTRIEALLGDGADDRMPLAMHRKGDRDRERDLDPKTERPGTSVIWQGRCWGLLPDTIWDTKKSTVCLVHWVARSWGTSSVTKSRTINSMGMIIISAITTTAITTDITVTMVVSTTVIGIIVAARDIVRTVEDLETEL